MRLAVSRSQVSALLLPLLHELRPIYSPWWHRNPMATTKYCRERSTTLKRAGFGEHGLATDFLRTARLLVSFA